MSAALIERIRSSVPALLRDLPVWLLHTADKRPVYATGRYRHGTLDSPADRAALVTFDRAADSIQTASRYLRTDLGLGVALGRVDADTTISGIDLDHCINADGVIDPRVIEIMGAAVSYAERSPSGQGVHIIGLGDIGTLRTPGLEIYSRQRYFTVTGYRLNQAALADLSDAATLARRLYQTQATRPTYTTRIVPIEPGLIEHADERWGGLVRTLQIMDMWRGTSRTRSDGTRWHDIICPWAREHTAGEITGTAVSEPSAANGWWGGFRCHHTHCEMRGMRDIRRWCRALVRLIDERSAS